MEEQYDQFMWYRGSEVLRTIHGGIVDLPINRQDYRLHRVVKFTYENVTIESPTPDQRALGEHLRLVVRTTHLGDRNSEAVEYITDAQAKNRYPKEWAKFKISGNYRKQKRSKFGTRKDSVAASRQAALDAAAWFAKEAADVLPTLEDMHQAEEDYAASFRESFMLALANPMEVPNQYDPD